MADRAKSLQARLYNIAQERGAPFQLILNQFGAEQFLERLSLSDYAKKFIFKGGTLLSYLIETDRKTKDLDFSIREISNQVKELLAVIQNIMNIKIDDEIAWTTPQGEVIDHLAMDYPGARIKCPFFLGNMKGFVRMDLALGDRVKAQWIPLPKLNNRGTLLAGKNFKMLTYPPESIFSEKLHATVTRGTENTRMKDFYDLHKLCQTRLLDPATLKEALTSTFNRRETALPTEIKWDNPGLEKIQDLWHRYLRKEGLEGAPKTIAEIIDTINEQLTNTF